MPRRRAEATAAELLGTWTDADTAMQIVGTSLGIFGADLLTPEVVLSKETPLRNALFDVLLSLVEGGALDVRPTGDGHYAFRWRADYAVGALTPEMATTVDIEVPSPYLAELADARRERDDALRRAASAEALAGDHGNDVGAADRPDPVAETEVAETEVAAPETGEHEAVEPEAPDEPDEPDEPEPEIVVEDPEPESVDLVELEAEEDFEAELIDVDADVDDPEPETGEVVYLTPLASDDAHDPGRSKWSPYTLDKPRSHLSSVERFANQG